MNDKIISLSLGYLTALVLFKYYNPTYIYHGPDSNYVRKYIHKNKNTCYKFEPIANICPL
jgi:hypothetical protein